MFLLRACVHRNLSELFSVNYFVVSQTNPYISAQKSADPHPNSLDYAPMHPTCSRDRPYHTRDLRIALGCSLSFLSAPRRPFPPHAVPIWRLLRAPPLMRCGFTRALGQFLEGEFRHWCRQAKLLLGLLGSRGGTAWVLLSTMGQEWEGNLTIRNMASLRQARVT